MLSPQRYDLHDGEPFWPRRDGILDTYPRLASSVRCEIVVVGAGITGALATLELTRRGHDVVVIDRRDVGGGATSASTSMLQYEIDELLIDLTAAIGPERALTAYRECLRGIDLVERATQAVGDTCGFRRSPSVFMATTRTDAKVLEQELTARAQAGFDVRWLGGDELAERWGLVAIAAIESAQAASVDPYRLCARALRRSIQRGARVFSRTEVVDFDLGSRTARLTTATGDRVTASHVVMATGYEVAALLPDLPLSLHASFAAVTEPINELDRWYPDGVLFWDYDDPYLYGRVTDDSRMLIGGRDEDYRDPRRRKRALPSKSRALARDLHRRLPRLKTAEFDFSWCGTFAETPDGLAYIGSHPSAPRCQFALGFGGNGITYSAIAAEYMADAIERAAPAVDVSTFALTRPVTRPAGSAPRVRKPR